MANDFLFMYHSGNVLKTKTIDTESSLEGAGVLP